MHVFLSPSKDMDFDSEYKGGFACTNTLFPKKSFELVKILRNLSLIDLQKIMAISPKLAQLNADRYKAWRMDQTRPELLRPAIFAFSGDVYGGFDAKSLNDDAIIKAQEGLLILSGLYGILRPLDLMQPYRLEMGRRIIAGQSLPQFWDRPLRSFLSQLTGDFFVNLASQEYSEAIPRGTSKHELFDGRPLYSVQFYDKHGKGFIIKGFFAKKARGAFARELCKNPIKKPIELKDISVLDYVFNPLMSTEFDLVFTR